MKHGRAIVVALGLGGIALAALFVAEATKRLARQPQPLLRPAAVSVLAPRTHSLVLSEVRAIHVPDNPNRYVPGSPSESRSTFRRKLAEGQRIKVVESEDQADAILLVSSEYGKSTKPFRTEGPAPQYGPNAVLVTNGWYVETDTTMKAVLRDAVTGAEIWTTTKKKKTIGNYYEPPMDEVVDQLRRDWELSRKKFAGN